MLREDTTTHLYANCSKSCLCLFKMDLKSQLFLSLKMEIAMSRVFIPSELQ